MSIHQLPPLNALRAFEAAARHMSFQRAAAELNVTPAALSHQIRNLESLLGLELFVRKTRKIALTKNGELLLPDISEGFDSLHKGVQKLKNQRSDNVFVITAGPAFTAKWLAPKLNRFLAANPQVDLRIAATLTLTDFESDGIDAAIRFGNGRYPGLYSELLMHESVLPVCKPSLLHSGKGLNTPADLQHHALIHDESLKPFADGRFSWNEWLSHAEASNVDSDRGLRFNLADHAIDAAIEGAGVLLARKTLAQRDLNLGNLVAPFKLEIPIQQAFYFVCPEGHEEREVVMLFRQWVMNEVTHDAKIEIVP